jgi:hypothetical protein
MKKNELLFKENWEDLVGKKHASLRQRDEIFWKKRYRKL